MARTRSVRARAVGLSIRSSSASSMPVDACNLPAISITASESIPTSSNGMSGSISTPLASCKSSRRYSSVSSWGLEREASDTTAPGRVCKAAVSLRAYCQLNTLRLQEGDATLGRAVAISGEDLMRTCTKIPLYPNVFTPPTREPAPRKAAICVGRAHGCACRALPTCSFKTRSCALGGATSPLKPRASLSRLVAPDAVSPWPTFAFTVPIARKLPEDRAASNAVLIEPASIGSPSGEPLAAASRQHTSSECRPASSRTARINCCCADPLGAVRLALRPDCLTAVASVVGRLPVKSLCSVRNEREPHASPRTYPSARLSKLWLRPRADVSDAAAHAKPTVGSSISITADASAARASPRSSARWAA
mmetsp:Transcript_14320/g.40242  ORF Transcript_14320/g.40242 Transcript_14320/m.40242 type:complete len:365 (-) Transcript_14320:3267-4361(-)|eukprot:scaffold22390_cov28-Tisochrysis_lutea.AAC.14